MSNLNYYICELLEHMRKGMIIVFFLLGVQAGMAQIHEIGVFLGGSNFIGDVGKTNYINPNKLAVGGLYKWNKSTRYAYRASLSYSNLHADDADSGNSGRQERGYSFSNRILEASLGMEFNFWEYDLHTLHKPFTPYIYGGISAFNYRMFYYSEAMGRLTTQERRTSIAFPFGLGVKGEVLPNLVLGAEVIARYTFANDLDGSNPERDPGVNYERFGNYNSKDWYVFSGITVTYTFGKRPCTFCYE
ncbi:type IX secretion system protein PorG [Sinomicrobium sp. M5D2P17]